MTRYRICNTVEAKAKLNELLDDISQGQVVVIQRRGKPVAKIVPATEETLDDREQIKKLMSRIKAFHQKIIKRHGVKSDTITLLRELREES